MKHTSGPWEWARDPYTREQFLAYCAEAWDNASHNAYDHMLSVVQATDANGGNLTIAILGNGPTAQFNGPLIAAAPELLEALQKAGRWYGEMFYGPKPDWYHKAEAAIAKATGD